jgi:hypothetical protein
MLPLRRVKFLEGLAFNVGNDRRNEPLRLAHFDHGDDRALLLKPVDRPPPNLRLSEGLIDLMKDFSLASAQGIGGTWLRPSTPFDERYGQW